MSIAKSLLAIALALQMTGGTVAQVVETNPPPAHSYQTTTLDFPAKSTQQVLDELFGQCALIVEGRVIGRSDPFEVESPDGRTAIFTDYEITAATTYRGGEEKTATVRVHGGTIGFRTEAWSPDPELQENQTYLLFLYQPDMGGAHTLSTKGDYYEIPDLTMGLFSPQDADTYRSKFGEELTRQTLLARLASTPFEEDYDRNRAIERYETRLADGTISQATYDDFMANLDVYATIVP